MARPKNRSGPGNPDEKARSPGPDRTGESQEANDKPDSSDREAHSGRIQNGPYPPDLDRYLAGGDENSMRRFITYAEGARMFRVPYWKFVRMVKMADANYPIRKIAVVDLHRLEAYMEEFHERYEKIWGEVPKRQNKDNVGE